MSTNIPSRSMCCVSFLGIKKDFFMHEHAPSYFNASQWSTEYTPMPVVTEAAVMRRERPRSLREEIAHFQTNWEEEGLPHNWADLPGIGFDTKMQVGFLEKSLSQSNSPASQAERLGVWHRGTAAELNAFSREYLQRNEIVYPISLTIENRDGVKRVVNSLHGGGKLLAETVSKTERNGSVYDVLVNRAETFFLSAPDGSIGMMVSPSGSSGMKDREGNTIFFPHSMTFLWEKRGEEIFGFGIQTDFSNAEHREVLQRLTGVPIATDAADEAYVRAAGFFSAVDVDEHGIRSMKDVVDSMRDTRFDQTGGSLHAYKDILWKDVYAAMKKDKKLWEVDAKTQEIIDEFTDFANSEQWSYKILQQALAITVLRMSKLIRGEKSLPKGLLKQGDTIFPISFGDVFEDMTKIPGCAGAGMGKGNSPSYIESIIKRFVISGESGMNSICNHCGNALECGVCVGCTQSVPVATNI